MQVLLEQVGYSAEGQPLTGSFMDYAKQYQEYLARANQALEKACETFLPEESEVCRAARYSLLGGGKRIRAVLVLAVCDMLNGSAEAAEQFAAAIAEAKAAAQPAATAEAAADPAPAEATAQEAN